MSANNDILSVFAPSLMRIPLLFRVATQNIAIYYTYTKNLTFF